MEFRKIQPPVFLKDYVQYFWTLSSDVADIKPKSLGPLADGFPGLIFQSSSKGIFFDQDNKKLPEVFLYGQTVTRTAIYLIGQFNVVAVTFFPHTLKSVFGFHASELTDSCLDLKLVYGNIAERMINTFPGEKQIDVLSGYIASMINKNSGYIDKPTKYAVSQIMRSNGNFALKDLQDELNISERSFERKFEQYVGISPKLFSKICRFQASFQQLKENRYNKLSDIAFENGYADQSHFIRVFKEFTGLSPFEFQKKSQPFSGDMPTLMEAASR
jgi:AraC-like DNA-binding protein